METTNHAKRLLEAQMLVRQQLADKGLQLDDALSVVAARKSELRQIVLDAVDVGLTEVEAAKLAGVARSTVREWLGKKT
jgi:predicted outer membrane protein